MMLTYTTIFYLKGQALLLNMVDITDSKVAREKLDELTAPSPPSWPPYPMR